MHRLRTSAAALALSTLVVAGAASTAGAGGGDAGRHVGRPFTMAVIGDIPYGDAQIAAFPARIDELNADPDVEMVVHVGDIKSGSSVCSDAYFAAIRAQFDRVDDPLVYTPGDNEWTDCHRPNNGAYDPLARLAAIRSTFFPTPGLTLGRHPATVESQAPEGYVENVDFERSGVAFATLHLVGSNNSLAPWTGKTAPTPEQTAEVLGRTSAGIELLRATFDRARTNHDRAVVLFTQADMFDETFTPTFADIYGFQPVVQALVDEAAHFDGPVYLFNGDSHVYRQDRPLAAGSKWLARYGVRGSADNLTRTIMEGSTGVTHWLAVTVDTRDHDVVSVRSVPFQH